MHGRRRQRRRRGHRRGRPAEQHGGGLQLLVLDDRSELSGLHDPGRESHLAARRSARLGGPGRDHGSASEQPLHPGCSRRRQSRHIGCNRRLPHGRRAGFAAGQACRQRPGHRVPAGRCGEHEPDDDRDRVTDRHPGGPRSPDRADRYRPGRAGAADHSDRGRRHRRRRDQRRLRPGERRHRLLREPGGHARPGQRRRRRSARRQRASARSRCSPTTAPTPACARPRGGIVIRPTTSTRSGSSSNDDRRRPDAPQVERRRLLPGGRRRRDRLQLRQLQAGVDLAPARVAGGLPHEVTAPPAQASSPSPPSTSRTSTRPIGPAKFDDAGQADRRPTCVRRT